MQGEEFQCDLKVMDIKTYDLILGLQWLTQALHHASWNYDDLAMSLWYNGSICTLKPIPKEGCKLIQRLEDHVEEGSQLFLHQAIKEPSQTSCVLHNSPQEVGQGYEGCSKNLTMCFQT